MHQTLVGSGMSRMSLKSLKSGHHGMFYSHFSNGVRNRAISITQWNFMNYYYFVFNLHPIFCFEKMGACATLKKNRVEFNLIFFRAATLAT